MMMMISGDCQLDSMPRLSVHFCVINIYNNYLYYYMYVALILCIFMRILYVVCLKLVVLHYRYD